MICGKEISILLMKKGKLLVFIPLCQNRHKEEFMNIQEQVVFKVLNSLFQRLFELVFQID